jgi:primosomal protein N' (replication factor Y)
MERSTFFVDMLLPLALPQLFTYRVPYGMENDLGVGKRASVPFANHHNYAALIWKIHEKAPDIHIAKYIQYVIDEEPIVTEPQMKFWEWIADYYLCTLGEVMNAALPSAFRLQSESKIVINPDYDGDISQLNEHEYHIVEALQHQPELSIENISKITGLKKTLNLIKNLRNKNIILIKEELLEKFKPKKEIYYKLHDKFIEDETALQEVFDKLSKRASKQMEVLMQYYLLSQSIVKDNENDDNFAEVKKSDLLQACPNSSAPLKELLKKDVLVEIERETMRLTAEEASKNIADLQLSAEQTASLNEIMSIYAF